MASVTAKPARSERFNLTSDGGERQEAQGINGKAAVFGPHAPPITVPTKTIQSPEHLREAWHTLRLLLSCAIVWIICAFVDAIYTPRDANYVPSRSLIISYQWCMVGYASNLILTLMKVIFETNRSKLKLHMVSCYINTLAATSYAMLWTGFSPIVPDVQSCLYIPQRWMLYCFTAPAIIYILCQISDYTTRMRVWVIMLNVGVTGKRGLGTTWNLFPFVYFAAIDGALSLEISEPLWAALDWLTKMVYSSSLMEANFFTIAQRREFAVRAIEEANRLATIQQLSTAIERKDDFLSAMSHELRTPLNGIIGLSESLMAGACGQLPEKAVKTISTVKLSGKRLLQLINDILDAAKMKQGTLVIKHEKVDIKRLVTDVLDLSLPLVRKGVRLVNNVGNVPKIVGDNGRIVQILYNLVGNAAKFTRQGVISITAGVSEDNIKVYVTVSDTGVGIPKEKVPKIFGAFEQADMSTTRRYGGTGLGLHLVKELVKAHGGEITVESESTIGRLGVLMLAPLLCSHTTRRFPYLPPLSYMEKYGGCMVLSVDDDPINQMVVENLLSPEGYKVEQAMSGSEALDFLKKTATLPDVILLDIMMPDMSGYEVCQEIRRRYSAVSIPIIMVSAKGHPEHVMKGLEAGSVDYVKKPFHRQELLSRIRAQVRNREIFEAEMESRKVTEMLKRILPMSVIQRLQQGQSMIADAHDEVTVLFASLSSRSTSDVVLVLNEMYGTFEKLLLKYQVFRVEHTSESYLVVSGHDGTSDHIKRILSMAVDMLSAVQQLTFPGGQQINIRIGVHTGPAYAGVVGIDNPRYCVFGDTVSVANALEAKGFDNTIHCSNAVYGAVRSKERDRGNVMFVPGRKSMTTGPTVMDTFIYKAGSWETALKQLEDEEREKEAAEREAKLVEEGAAATRREGQEALAAQERARAEALAAQIEALEAERRSTEARVEMEAAEKRRVQERLAAEAAAKAAAQQRLEAERVAAKAARAEAEALRNRAEAVEAERLRLKVCVALFLTLEGKSFSYHF
ncbi:hypothetical protein VOLCADRAFT_93268 [Volvox carteri f. nagariensis]|uniref:histidine kinase n=1 Tax=Volvox carteri f. nagariensis TaxID=3068 RepID=D8U1P4_VOLCA|nr:uncharacterized protein VOLCADRAFT_93268 [Volvox carteri f. nagariensis]EFJ46446.1 hypothetical protein VOLCADRAFT_93268 [Volvox carteri f. nagariensis]|eukprot:XP_002952599.1 hypothetical protein VOLCADRAFT_93268 [Volvox carteri f. nagariensis]